MSPFRFVLFSLVLSSLAASASAQHYEAAVAGGHTGCGITPVGIPSRRTWVYRSGAGPTTPTETVAAGPNGRVLAAVRSGNSFEIHSVTPARSTPVAYGLPEYSVLSMVAARNGTIFVLAEDFPNRVVMAFDVAGNIAGVHPLDFYDATSLDLAADQCTLWIAARDRVGRFNVCTSTRLSDFVVPSPMPYAMTVVYGVSILPDGGAVVLERGALRRYDTSGTLVRSYPVEMQWEGRSAVALANGGKNALVSVHCSEQLFRIDLNTGATEMVGEHFITDPNSVVPYASWTAALGAAQHRRRSSRP